MLSVTAEQLQHTRSVHDQLKCQVMTRHVIEQECDSGSLLNQKLRYDSLIAKTFFFS